MFRAVFLIGLMSLFARASQTRLPGNSLEVLRQRLEGLDAAESGQVGLYVKNLKTGQSFSFRSDELWYIASGVKLPMVVAALKQVDRKTLSLDTRVVLREEDFVDGAGATNFQKPGSRLPLRYLIEQILVHSDNTASDLLIRTVGLEPINALVKEVVPEGFSRITSLTDVRRLAYSEFHPAASKLGGRDFIVLKAMPNDQERVLKLISLLNISADEMRCRTLHEAFNNYYETQVNSATLISYGLFLEKLAKKQLLKTDSSKFLIQTMTRTATGRNRIKAGLPAGFRFAHKTGTQYSRICDFGVAWGAHSSIEDGTIIVACSRNFTSLDAAERAFRVMAKAVAESELL